MHRYLCIYCYYLEYLPGLGNQENVIKREYPYAKNIEYVKKYCDYCFNRRRHLKESKFTPFYLTIFIEANIINYIKSYFKNDNIELP